jgi:hypothetical protein
VWVFAFCLHRGTTRIDTSHLAISFFFDEFVDLKANNIVIDATGNTIAECPGKNSPSHTLLEPAAIHTCHGGSAVTESMVFMSSCLPRTGTR